MPRSSASPAEAGAGHTGAPRSLGHLLRRRAENIGGRPLFRFGADEASFAEVEERTNRLANVLEARGVRGGDRVAVVMPNGIDFPVAWLAIAKVGAVMVPVNTRYREEDLSYVLNDSGAVLALAGAEQAGQVLRVRPRCPSLSEVGVLGGAGDGAFDLDAVISEAPAAYDIGDVGSGDLVNLQYTSGTTGFPKGCMLTHGYWLEMGRLVADHLGVGEDDVDLTAQPFYYMDPQWNTVLCMLAGIPLVILPRFSASTFWRSVKESGATFFYILGTMPVYLLKQPEEPEVEKRHRVRVVICSGIVPRLHAVLEERWGVPWREAYGMTETGVDLLVPLEDGASVGTGSVGVPVESKEARIIGEDGDEVPDGESGELVVRGSPMMLGYWNRPEATARTIRDGWLHTGDLAYRDGKGRYHLVGRLKDMVRRSAENVSAAEVEGVLAEHPAVRAAAVVPIPDELRGEEVKAFVQLRPDAPPGSADPQAIVDFVKERLAAFKAPRFVEFVEGFPLTPSEKIAKRELLATREDQRKGTYDAEEGAWL